MLSIATVLQAKPTLRQSTKLDRKEKAKGHKTYQGVGKLWSNIENLCFLVHIVCIVYLEIQHWEWLVFEGLQKWRI